MYDIDTIKDMIMNKFNMLNEYPTLNNIKDAEIEKSLKHLNVKFDDVLTSMGFSKNIPFFEVVKRDTEKAAMLTQVIIGLELGMPYDMVHFNGNYPISDSFLPKAVNFVGGNTNYISYDVKDLVKRISLTTYKDIYVLCMYKDIENYTIVKFKGNEVYSKSNSCRLINTIDFGLDAYKVNKTHPVTCIPMLNSVIYRISNFIRLHSTYPEFLKRINSADGIHLKNLMSEYYKTLSNDYNLWTGRQYKLQYKKQEHTPEPVQESIVEIIPEPVKVPSFIEREKVIEFVNDFFEPAPGGIGKKTVLKVARIYIEENDIPCENDEVLYKFFNDSIEELKKKSGKKGFRAVSETVKGFRLSQKYHSRHSPVEPEVCEKPIIEQFITPAEPKKDSVYTKIAMELFNVESIERIANTELGSVYIDIQEMTDGMANFALPTTKVKEVLLISVSKGHVEKAHIIPYELCPSEIVIRNITPKLDKYAKFEANTNIIQRAISG